MTSYSFRVRLDDNGVAMLTEALSRYHEHCKQKLMKRETLPFQAHMNSIRSIRSEFRRELRKVDRRQSRAKHQTEAESQGGTQMTQYHVIFYFSWYKIEMLKEVMSHYQAHCEQNLAKGEATHLERHIQAIQETQAEIEEGIRRTHEKIRERVRMEGITNT